MSSASDENRPDANTGTAHEGTPRETARFNQLTRAAATRPSRRTIAGILGLGTLVLPALAEAKKGKKPETYPERMACRCQNDEPCFYMPYPPAGIDPMAPCSQHCASRGGLSRWAITNRSAGKAAVCAIGVLNGATIAPWPLI